jgi:mRNA interferase RelE/StbE
LEEIILLDILYSRSASKQLKKINRGDQKVAHMIISEIEKYAYNQDMNFNIKQLKGEFRELKRLRVGKYRIIFDEDDSIYFSNTAQTGGIS